MKLFLLVSLALVATACAASVGKPKCGGASSSKKIQLTNPTNPPRECVYKIKAYSSNVCQLRIEMSYTLAQPSLPTQENGLKHVTCDKDYFQAGEIKLCGVENYQHIYLPFNRSAGVTSVDLKIALAHRVGQKLPAANWNIQVKQLECPDGGVVRGVMPIGPILGSSTPKDGFFLAPDGCLQYYPESEGTITSFNFNNGDGMYPGGLNYAICFRRSTETKSLILQNNFFKMGSNANENEDTDEFCSSQNSQVSGYLLIPQSIVEPSGQRASYFCGSSIANKQIVSTNPGPLMVIFNSEGLLFKESGFSFDYQVSSE